MIAKSDWHGSVKQGAFEQERWKQAALGVVKEEGDRNMELRSYSGGWLINGAYTCAVEDSSLQLRIYILNSKIQICPNGDTRKKTARPYALSLSWALLE